MKFIDEYRHPALLTSQLAELRRGVSRRWVITDVCGGQTHSLLRHGLEATLEDVLELVHGPGCPACLTPAEAIDDAVELAKRPGVIVASFGDMLRVPGRSGSLLLARAAGADVRTVYSPVDAVQLAAREPSRQVVFFGVGFETTASATALAVLQARQLGVTNFSVLVHHVRVEPAMRAVMQLPDNRVQDFLETQSNKLAFSTDGYTVTPLFFPGGDIGRLAVFGTVNVWPWRVPCRAGSVCRSSLRKACRGRCSIVSSTAFRRQRLWPTWPS